MAPKLSDLLINEGLISQAQLEEALKCQVIFGGRLGTNLVEMDLVKESDVIRCLSKQLERPFISPEELMSVPPDIISLIPPEIAEKFKIVPVNLEKKRLTVAMMNPSDLAAIDKISFITGFIIVPVVCSELRLIQALEHYYGIKRELRFIRVDGETRGRSGEAIPPDPAIFEDDIFPDWLNLPAPESITPVAKPHTEGENGALLPDQSANDPELIEIPLAEEDILDLDEPVPQITPPIAAVQLEQMDRRSREADHVYRNTERVALFIVKGRTAVGWKAHIRNKEVAGFENFQLTLEEPSALKLVADTRSFYLGPILDTPGNRKLLAALGGGAPESALLVPLMMMGRVVMVFYLDGGKELTKALERLQNAADMADLEVLYPLFFHSLISTGFQGCGFRH